jgi:hypothetical protein
MVLRLRDVSAVQEPGWNPTLRVDTPGAERRPIGEQLDWHEARAGDGPDLALALAVTRKVEDDVLLYAREHEPAIGRVLVLTPKGGAGQTSVRDANHALALAEDTTLLLQRHRTVEERRRPLHVFIAAPVQFAMLLGREARAYGPTVTYEYDFPTQAPGAYSASFHLPPEEA